MPDKFTLEKIDKDNFKKIDTHEEVTILNIQALQKEKIYLEQEVARFNQQLAEINTILDEYNKL